MVNNQMAEHPQNLALRHVVSSCSLMIYTLQAIRNGVESLTPELTRALKTVKGETLNDKLEEIWKELQVDVDHVMDSNKGQSAGQNAQMMGLKQVIEKKEGLFRMHMMGKRVNYAARTVITPDPNIHIEEIGIPDLFAKTLTFPTPVTPWNVQIMRKLILAGPHVHPG
jgi:DNA-directed RNA polymerase I subunit RPA1